MGSERRRSHLWWIVPGIFLSVWLIVVLASQCLASGTLTGFGAVGDAFGPVGTALTLAGLLFAFEQAREARDQAHQDRAEAHRDREGAYLDRLADAYARWIPVARQKLRDLEQLTNAINHASWHAQGQDLLEARHKLKEITPLISDIAIAATEVLLLERDASLREHVQKLIKPLSMDVYPQRFGMVKGPAGKLVSVTSERRSQMELLVAAVSTRLSRGSIAPDPVEPVPTAPPMDDDGDPAVGA